jgi:hypothetical protein
LDRSWVLSVHETGAARAPSIGRVETAGWQADRPNRRTEYRKGLRGSHVVPFLLIIPVVAIVGDFIAIVRI